MDERLRFVARLLEGEKMAPLCAEFGISRKTGYKIFDRYKDCGVQALTDRSRRPYRQANRLPAQLEALIVRLKREYPGWGAPKIREKLRRQSTAPHLPAISTVHAVLDRHGLVKRRRRRHHATAATFLSQPTEPSGSTRRHLALARDCVHRLAPQQAHVKENVGIAPANAVDIRSRTALRNWVGCHSAATKR